MDEYRRLLGVSEGASLDEIKKAYRQAVKKYHPDAGGSVAQFQRVQDAFEALTSEAEMLRASPKKPQQDQSHSKQAKKRPPQRKSAPTKKPILSDVAMGWLAFFGAIIAFAAIKSIIFVLIRG